MDQPLTSRKRRPAENGPETVWIFDLDNTLYPERCNLFAHIDVRMGEFIANLLGVEKTEARRVQKDYFVRFGTTLRGLIEVHDVNPEDFLNFVHDIDLSGVPRNDELATRLSTLEGRKYVFTNGDVPYASRVLEKIGITDKIDGVFDIAMADYVPKPHPETYRRFVEHFDVRPENAIMFEDMARNLVPAAKLGMTTVWLRTSYQWGAIDYDKEHIHYEAEHLMAWFEENLTGK